MRSFGSIKKVARLTLLLAAMPGWIGAAGATARSNDPVAIRHWDSDDGLPPGTIATMLQTRDGYLWFGMHEGLGRFDGVRCTVYDEFVNRGAGEKALFVLL